MSPSAACILGQWGKCFSPLGFEFMPKYCYHQCVYVCHYMSNINSCIDWRKEKGAGHRNSGHRRSTVQENFSFLYSSGLCESYSGPDALFFRFRSNILERILQRACCGPPITLYQMCHKVLPAAEKNSEPFGIWGPSRNRGKDSCFWSRWNNKSAYVPLPTTWKKKTDKNTWNNVFQDPGYQTMKDGNSWKTRNKWGNPSIATAYCLEGISRLLWHREGEPRWSSTDSLVWGDGAENPGRPRKLEFSGQYWRRDMDSERTWYLQSLSWIFRVLTDTCMWGNHLRLVK